jgi:hypothetical protein
MAGRADPAREKIGAGGLDRWTAALRRPSSKARAASSFFGLLTLSLVRSMASEAVNAR